MRHAIFLATLGLAFSAWTAAPDAQTMLTQEQIIKSLQGVQRKATLNP